MTRILSFWIIGAVALALCSARAEEKKTTDDANEWVPLKVVKTSTPAIRPEKNVEYAETITRTANMVKDVDAQKLVKAAGLNLINLTWEDTGRYKNSSVGPNISDMTIQVAFENIETKKLTVKSMPVIRYANFSDKTVDIDPRDFTLLVGNEKGGSLKRISLYDFLKDPTAYLSNPNSWRNKTKTLLADRDSKVLVSAQACFLPVPKEGKATFNPVLFNYQSVSGDPAVLTLLATREGSSTTVIDNKRDAFREGAAWGQRLFLNLNGQRASLTGQRLSDFEKESGIEASGKVKAGLNMVLLVQIPLKQKNPMKPGITAMEGVLQYVMKDANGARGSDVEAAVIGHGDLEGPFTEIDDLSIERDPNFPVRVTVQFYKATSNGIVSEEDISTIKKEIDGIYAQGENAGSLVVGGETGRITEYAGAKVEPKDWWEDFWRRHEENTGDSREEAIKKLKELLGVDYEKYPVTELYLRDLLRSH